MAEYKLDPETEKIVVADCLKAFRTENLNKWGVWQKYLGPQWTMRAFILVLLYRGVRLIQRLEKEKLLRKPPTAFLLRFSLPPEIAEELISNFTHHFETVWLKEHSPRQAQLIYKAQMSRPILSYYFESLKTVIGIWIASRK